jgi:hypothetical protein
MKNRQNMLKQSNQLKSNQKISADSNKGKPNLPMISNQNTQNSLNGQHTADIHQSSMVSSGKNTVNNQIMMTNTKMGSSMVSQGSVSQVRRQGGQGNLSTQQFNSNQINTYSSGGQQIAPPTQDGNNTSGQYKTNTLD